MPCETIQRTTVQFGKSTDPDLLFDALKTLKLSPRVDGHQIKFGSWEDFDTYSGKMTIGAWRDIREIKREYSRQVLVSQSAKFGWVAEAAEEGKEVQHVRV
jgi:hypothetical protein